MGNRKFRLPVWAIITGFISSSIYLLVAARYNGHKDVMRDAIILIVASGLLSFLFYNPAMKFKEKRRRRKHDLKALLKQRH